MKACRISYLYGLGVSVIIKMCQHPVYTAGRLLPLILRYRSRANTSVMPER